MDAPRDPAAHHVTLEMLTELEGLNSRVERLEGIVDMFHKAKDAAKSAMHKASEMVSGKPNKELTQKDVLDCLHAADPSARHTQGNAFAFTLHGTEYQLEWNQGDVAFAFHVSGGSVNSSVHTLSELKRWLAEEKKAPATAAPADLQRYAAAVLRQQMAPARPGR